MPPVVEVELTYRKMGCPCSEISFIVIDKTVGEDRVSGVGVTLTSVSFLEETLVMKAFKSVVLIAAVVWTMIFVASPPARSNPAASMQGTAKALAISVVAQYCPPGCSCTGGCTCGIGNPCTHSDCRAAATLAGCTACCALLTAPAVCTGKCAAPPTATPPPNAA